MKKLYVVDIYKVIGGEKVDTYTNVSDVLTVRSEITDESYSIIVRNGRGNVKFNHSEYVVEVLR
jgi:hypothetical protein